MQSIRNTFVVCIAIIVCCQLYWPQMARDIKTYVESGRSCFAKEMGQRLALGFTGPVKIGQAIPVVLGAQFTLLLSVGE